MNDLASLLSSAMHEHAQEIEMSIDTQKAETQLKESIAAAKRRRTVWTGLAAAAVLVVVAGVAFAFLRPTPNAAPVTPPTPSPSSQPAFVLDASLIDPPLTAQLPFWTATAEGSDASPSGYTYVRKICSTPTGLCTEGDDRMIHVAGISHMYPLDSTTSISPTYARYVQAWKDVDRLGYGTVSEVTSTTIDGRAATTMTVAVTKAPDGLGGCEKATDRSNEGGCFGIVPGLTLNLAIVDRGAGQPPTLLYESHNTANTAEAAEVADEFRTWLGTVQLS